MTGNYNENNRKINKISNDKKRLLMSALMLFVSIMLMFTAAYAWYAGNRSATAENFSLTTDNSNVRLTDTFTITRVLPDDSISITYTFKKDADGYYYEYDIETQSWVLDEENNKKPVQIGGLLPNEYLIFEITFERYGKVVNMDYDIMLMGVTGDQIEGTDYTVLGVYRINMIDSNDNLLSDIWLDNYSDGYQPASQQTLLSGAAWPSSETTQTIRFRMTFDTAQLSQLHLTTTNVLSEKSISISGVRLSVTNIY